MTEPSPLDLTSASVLIPLLRRHRFTARKAVGQHLLISRSAVDAIVGACALHEGRPILEIGPGVGTVTRALAERGAQVVAVELDARAIAVLQETVGEFPRVRVAQGDILAADLAALLRDARWTVVGNIPYYITTPIISRLLEHASSIVRAVLMVQREVADRLLAAPGGKDYGALTVFVQTRAAVERIVRVPPGAFLPPPKVESTVVRLAMREEPLVPAELQETFSRVVRAAFGQRRKSLGNALAGGGVLGGDRAAVAAALEAAGILSARRGETLGIAEFLRVTREVLTRG